MVSKLKNLGITAITSTILATGCAHKYNVLDSRAKISFCNKKIKKCKEPKVISFKGNYTLPDARDKLIQQVANYSLTQECKKLQRKYATVRIEIDYFYLPPEPIEDSYTHEKITAIALTPSINVMDSEDFCGTAIFRKTPKSQRLREEYPHLVSTYDFTIGRLMGFIGKILNPITDLFGNNKNIELDAP